MQKLEYKFLNMDTKTFAKTGADLVTEIGKGFHRCLTDDKSGQVLLAASKNHFTKTQARRLCQKLTGIIK